MSSDSPTQSLIDPETDDQFPVLPSPPASSTLPGNPEVGTIRMTLRLVFGSVVLGREEMQRRFTGKQAQLSQGLSTQTTLDPQENSSDRARYAAVGALVQMSDMLDRGSQQVFRTSESAFHLASRLASPVTDSRVMGPFRRQFKRFEVRGEQVLERWVAAGRREEYLSRALAQETATETIEEVLDYLAVSPEMDQLVQAQTQDMAGEVVEEIQERTTRIFVFRRLFRQDRSG